MDYGFGAGLDGFVVADEAVVALRLTTSNSNWGRCIRPARAKGSLGRLTFVHGPDGAVTRLGERIPAVPIPFRDL